jgi:hypothetical protein
MFICFSDHAVSEMSTFDTSSVTLAQAVRESLDKDLSVQDSIQRRYCNLTAIARILKPTVEETLGHDVNMASLVTAVKRVRVRYEVPPEKILSVIANSIVNVRTHVAKMSLEKTRRALDAIGRTITSYKEEFLQVSESVSAITLIFDQRLVNDVMSLFKKDEILESRENLAAIIVKSPIEIIQTPGCAIAFYNQVSRRHVNIEDTTSCYTDTIIVVKMEDAGRAFTALTDLISTSKRPLEKRGRTRLLQY